MCFSAKKRHASEVLSMSKLSKRIRHDVLVDKTLYRDEQDQDITKMRTPSPQSTTRQNVLELLEMLDRVQYQAKHLQEEHEETRMRHEEEVERYRDRIDSLDEEVCYQQTIIDVISEDIDRLEEETERQTKEIEELLEREYCDTIARKDRVEVLKDHITQLIDGANL
ncbi:hypothetical protein BDR03DRAFT_986554 [Suillus americanus]|nr:hypothetical protein BDR03DRAFT_986554 [Suillus americanus]